MKKIILLISLFLLVGCTFEIPNLNGNNNGTKDKITDKNEEITNIEQPTKENPPTNGNDSITEENKGKDYFDEQKTENLYCELFDLNNKITISIKISELEIAKIESDYHQYGSNCNINRIAESVSITIKYPNGTSDVKIIEEVGIRMKGNTTRHSFYSNGIESLIHFKLDFQETFDDDSLYNSEEIKAWNNTADRDNRKNRTFFGLRGLELKYNAEGDLTYTRDVYASKIYKENGIYAQSTTVGILDFNIGNNKDKCGTLGVYKIYEPVDRVFIKRYFESDNNDGDLYKATWGSAKGMPSLNSNSSKSYGIDEGKPGVQKAISYDLKTNKKKSTHESIKEFLTWINSSSKNLNGTLSNYINKDYFITWLSIMYITGDWDNFMYDSNNYYMYFDEQGICYFIPYDMDRTFGLQAKMHDMAYKTPVDTWNLQGSGNRSNLLKKTIDISNSSLRNEYIARCKELAPSILDAEKFKATYELIYNNYKNDIIPTMKTLKYNYEEKTSNPFYHLIVGNGEYIKYKDSTSVTHAFDSYFAKKKEVIKNS